ncbi:MAG: MBL fold metallo-hydrolase [Bosea sp. (in: a-proteobacteria)]
MLRNVYGRLLKRLLLGACALMFAGAASAADPGCKPDVASLPGHIVRASLKSDEARISFVGHATFMIESAQGVTAATDYNDYVRASTTPVIATMNKAHTTHYSRNPESGITHLLRGWDPGGGKAEHDITERDMRVRNVPTNIRSFSGATDYDGNSIFIFEVGELCVVHLGHLHHTLEPGHLRAIGRVDVLLVPVDGGFTLDMEGMFEVLKTLQARVMIPMHFFGQSTLERFLAKASVDWPVERRDVATLVVSRATLPRQPTVIVLPGR